MLTSAKTIALTASVECSARYFGIRKEPELVE